MAVANADTAYSMGRSFATMVRDEPAARRLWVRLHRGNFEFWLATEPIEAVDERRFQAAAVALQDELPDVNIQLRILNPRHFDSQHLEELIPAGAEEIPLREN